MPHRRLPAARGLAFISSCTIALLAGIGCQGTETGVEPDDRPSIEEQPPAPLLALGPSKDRLADRYIVVFRDDVADPDRVTDELVRAHGGGLHYRYTSAIKGFAATLPAQALAGIRRNPKVSYIEQDAVMNLDGSQTNPPSWGLDRINQRALPLDLSYDYENDGAGVRVYVLDTGILPTHQEYSGRVAHGWDFIDNDADATDCQGHGTHVAGTVGGTNVGVAKKATLVSVRVLDCVGSGSYSGVIAGVDWVTANAVKPAVANMSLGGGLSSALNASVNKSVASGVVYAVAAGNSGADACTFSPASAGSALTVGAIDPPIRETIDGRAFYSNFGACLDLFAPGTAIYSATRVANNTYASWSGTSMATPHVAGVAALYLSAHPAASPTEVEGAIESGAARDLVGGAGEGSPNLLLYSLVSGGTTAPPAPPPPPPPAPSPITDLAITSVVAPASAVQGTTVSVSVTLKNVGNQDIASAFSVTLSDATDNVTIRAQNVSGLAVGGTTTWTFSWNTTGGSVGTHTLRASHNLSDGNTSNDYYAANVAVTAPSTSPTPPPPPDTVRVHSGDLDGVVVNVGKGYWKAQGVYTVHNSSHQPVAGIRISGSWTGGYAAAGSCVTGADGKCVIETGNIVNDVKTVAFAMSTLSATGIIYSDAANHDPDGDSMVGFPGTRITIRRQ